MTSPPNLSPYEHLGGAAVLRDLVTRFYRYMDELPEAGGIRAMHGRDLADAEGKLFMFLSGWLGGPNLYWEAFGHPRLRMRHLPFSIGASERDQWLACMGRALDDTVSDPALRASLYAAFSQTAQHMINRAE
ncbi:MAG: group II truncated hemoglobin [Methylococcaceae bacterium]|jgi:hemoglobin